MPAWFPGGREWHDQDRGHRGSGKAGRAVVRDLQRLRVEPLVPVAPGTALTAVPQMELLAVIDGAAGRGGWALTDGTGSSAATVLVDLDRRRLEVTVGDPGTPSRSLAAELQPRRRHQLRVFLDGSLLEVSWTGRSP